ncbi:MAG: hypothetical protein COZ37_03860 [bacterium (Candidatus Ratteibacteria) CG_4_10_14_3_um_filter_41_18]|uniref:Zinc ribbon domain-containing protein n=4 Tax=Candidatus Ratteibacteria TaxID=2979319 RepID=A0A2M7E8A8_9BACT|nr:MAG: hypothetical protein COS11_04535 [bacterium (Candidatus Ratteibacteria) CG01_land_8_20_14_3_00_40_19]PIW73765.1 MAG: hypothetical protein CO004_04290 [bacterium (Candidatus Ratteibacteria) CG_4_8_14_3_um_filter_41_36]PIX77203.1 MAG: hypothetical protein COZ37_03860 [bacterium (Candidatus Ratteibacteria) CG_4_10_14_3_um_filter_41_18]PJA62352.1 MAG: hypothetical protein CO162_01675 [bacterium (Candidatus Ratteibacteria) CG_4_9_14_3_um_filter_41_21]
MGTQVAGQKKGPVVTLILVILVALFFIVKQAIPKKYYYTADLKCESCGNVFQQKIAAGITFPIKCPKCENKSAYQAIKCLDCGEVFTMKPVPIAPGAPEEMMPPEMEMPKCPKCGSMNLGPVFEREKATSK